MFFNCSNQDVLEDTTNRTVSSVDLRGSETTCNNLIRNGNFENSDNELQGINGTPDWNCFNLSPDVVNNQFNWSTWNPTFGQGWNNLNFSSNMGFMCAGRQSSHTEALVQRLIQPVILNGSVNNGNPLYTLALDYSTTHYVTENGNNHNLKLSISIGNNTMQTECSNNINALPADGVNIEISIPNNTVFHPVSQTYCAIINDGTMMIPSQIVDANDIVLQASSNVFSSDNAEGLLIDNISLTCTSECLRDILYTEFSECLYRFSPDWGCDDPAVRYRWDFGDGNTSNEKNPIHTYTDGGLYTVTLEAIDSNGCCTSQEISVTCGEVEQTSHCICWSANEYEDWEQSMQVVAIVHGFNYIDEFGQPQQKLVQTPQPTGYNLDGVFSALVIAQDGTPITFDGWDDPLCSKGGTGQEEINGFSASASVGTQFVGLYVRFETVYGGGFGIHPFPLNCN